MSTQVSSVNNLTFTRNAMKYLQGQELKEKSVGEEILGSLPTSVAFASAYQIIPAVSKAVKFNGVKSKVAEGEFAKIWSGTVKNNATLDAVKNFAKENPKKFTSLWGKVKSIFVKKSEDVVKTNAAENAAKKVTGNLSKVSENLFTKEGAKQFFSMEGLKGLMGQAKGFFLFNMLFQLPNVISAFTNGGTNEGLKQTAKSAAHAAGDAVAYAAGMKIGAAAGAKIGTAIGTAGGPVGALIGGALGMIIGGVASSLVSKLITKVVGKSYNEEKTDEQNEAVAQQIANDDATVQELQASVAQKITEDQADGTISEDTKEMINELNALQANSNTQDFGAITTANANNQQTAQAVVNNPYMNNAQQEQGVYSIYNIPRNADGSIDHSIYRVNLAA